MYHTLHLTHCILHIASYTTHLTTCTCCKLHVLQLALVATCTCCNWHLLQLAPVASCTCFKLHVLQVAIHLKAVQHCWLARAPFTARYSFWEIFESSDIWNTIWSFWSIDYFHISYFRTLSKLVCKKFKWWDFGKINFKLCKTNYQVWRRTYFPQ